MQLRSTRNLIILCVVLTTAGLLSAYQAQGPSSPASMASELSERLSSEVQTMEAQAATLRQSLNQARAFHQPPGASYSFFLYANRALARWTDNTFVPTYAAVADTFELKLLKAGNGDYLLRKWTIDERSFLVGVIPLYRKYTITNEYLAPEWNLRIFQRASNAIILEPGASSGIPVCAGNICPFKVNAYGSVASQQGMRAAALVFFGMAIVSLVVLLCRWVQRARYPEAGIVLAYLVLLGLRVLMVRLNFPADFTDSDIFNPQIFAASALNASLGDLILNELVVLLLCFLVFQNYMRFKSFRWFYRRPLGGWLFSVLCGLCVLFAALFPFVVIQTLYNNSTLALDISESLRFDKPRALAIAAVVIAGVCSFLFAHAFIRIVVAGNNRTRMATSFLTAMALFAMINHFTQQEYISSLVLGGAYVLTVYFLKLYTSLRRLGFATFAYLFVAVFYLSANGAYGFQMFGRKERIENQFRFANNFLIDRDNFGEYLLAEAARNIARDAFVQTRIGSPFLSRDVIRQKIRQVFLPAYFNKYDVDIFLFNAAGEPIDNHTTSSFSALLQLYNKDAYRTDYESVYFVNDPVNDVAQQYLVVVPVRRLGGIAGIAGYTVLELSLKKIIPESVYPELLVDNSFQEFYRTHDLNYAVYTDGRISYSSGAFNYAQQFDLRWLGDAEIHTTGLYADGYDHIAVEDENLKAAVVSSQRQPWFLVLANFSFMMVMGLIIILFFIMGQGLLHYVRGDKLYFAARIQLLLNLAFFVPLIIVSVIALQLINRSSQNLLNEQYLNKAKTVGEQVAARMSELMDENESDAISFENRITDIAKLANLDLNVYSTQGLLIATSQPVIFENDLLSRYIRPTALQQVQKGEQLFVETEQVGKLKYFVSYTVLKSPLTGDAIGILGIPFFRSGASLEKVQVTILANILNIFTLIFIALTVLAYFVSKWLTFPLTFITQSLRKTSLTKINQPLVWRSDDEIGLMVKEYNQMLYNLSESKAELEQSQREKAWREIAQQVAHEIKNPLTPMKLTLQQWERTLRGGTPSAEKTEKAIASLLTQVDTLNDIASSFSSFAKMPEPVMQPLEMVGLVKRIVDLHGHSGTIHFRAPSREIRVQGDEQLLGRTFSNIILNAFQAYRPGESPLVQIAIQQNPDAVVISFRDSGKGIEPAVAERIFFPHFTTKKSGSGLGLAIARQAIEQMKGRIWFETTVGKGTTFFIELPLVKG